MGYLKDFRDDVTARIEALDTQCRDDVAALVNFIVNAVLSSYRNGQKDARPQKKREGRKDRTPKQARGA